MRAARQEQEAVEAGPCVLRCEALDEDVSCAGVLAAGAMEAQLEAEAAALSLRAGARGGVALAAGRAILSMYGLPAGAGPGDHG